MAMKENFISMAPDEESSAKVSLRISFLWLQMRSLVQKSV